jgi:hypothetical protein
MKSYSELLDKIQEIRTENNKNWMDILRLSFKHSPKEAAELMKKITNCDAKINQLTKQLGEIK